MNDLQRTREARIALQRAASSYARAVGTRLPGSLDEVRQASDTLYEAAVGYADCIRTALDAIPAGQAAEQLARTWNAQQQRRNGR